MAEGGGQERRIGRAAPRVAAGSKCAQRVAVIALTARDEMLALRLTTLDEILARELDCGFDRFRSAADEIGVGKSPGLVADKVIGESFGRLGRKERGMGIGEFRGLARHRLKNFGMLMAEAGNRSAARGIEHALAILANQPDSF